MEILTIVAPLCVVCAALRFQQLQGLMPKENRYDLFKGGARTRAKDEQEKGKNLSPYAQGPRTPHTLFHRRMVRPHSACRIPCRGNPTGPKARERLFPPMPWCVAVVVSPSACVCVLFSA
jgi:hypothetical protein